MRTELAKAIKQPVLFIDDWVQPPKGSVEDNYERPGLTDLKKWRLQMLLAVYPWGIPSLALGEAYKKMFGKELDIQDLGFEHLSEMISELTDIITVQESDETTAIMFPDYPHDKILHDARYGHEFEVPNATESTLKESDPEMLISLAWLNRDEDFPPDVVLAGEQYNDIILPMTLANLPKARGIYRVLIVGAAHPNRFYINVKGPDLDRIGSLSGEVSRYFKECGRRIEQFSVPDEFIYPGFPCLVYVKEQGIWERCSVLQRSSSGNKVLVETVDYGDMRTVSPIYLYLMPRKFFLVPKQGILVSLMGTKATDGSESWSGKVGTRLRCFSNTDYWLDCVLWDTDKKARRFQEKQPLSSSSSDESAKSDAKSLSKKRRRRLIKDPQFEVLLCDRNDDDMDIYLDEILVMETYAAYEEEKSLELKTQRELFKNAIASIPRPKNPLN